MKELDLKIKIIGNNLATSISQRGFEKDISGIMEIIGLLEAVKKQYLNKVETLLSKEM